MTRNYEVESLRRQLKERDEEIKKLSLAIDSLKVDGSKRLFDFRALVHEKLSRSRDDIESIKLILIDIAKEMGVSAASFLVNNDSQKDFHIIARYPEVEIKSLEGERIPFSAIPYSYQLYLQGKPSVINKVDELPVDSFERKTLSDNCVKSMLSFPLFYGGLLKGLLVVHSGAVEKTWSDNDIEFISTFSSLLLEKYNRYIKNKFDSWFDKYERVLLSANEQTVITDCLYDCCKLLGVDSGVLIGVEVDANSVELLSSYPEHCYQGHYSVDSIKNDYPWGINKLLNDEVVVVNDYKELYEIAPADYRTLRNDKQKSLITVPLLHKNKLLATLTFYNIDKAHYWTSQEVAFGRKIITLLYSASQRIKLFQARYESMATLEFVLKCTGVSYWIVNKDLSYSHLSPLFFDVMNASFSDLQAPQIIETFFSDEAKVEEKNLRCQVFETGRPASGMMRFIADDESDKWMDCQLSPFNYDDDNNVQTIIMSIDDVTHQVIKQKELEASREEADKANADKSLFLAKMSHEIRTPMNAIIGMAHLLKDSELDDDQSEKLMHIDMASRNLLGIINDILDFSKIETGKVELENSDYDLRLLIDNCLHIVSHQNNNNIQLVSHIDKRLPKYIRGDPLRMRQVLINLLSNAVKFTGQGQVSVNLDVKNDLGFMLSVNDQGVGIDQDSLARLFTPYSQADNTITRRFGGTGLGLSIVKSLVELMGGKISVTSTVGVGSCFTIELPLQVSNQESIEKNEFSTIDPENFYLLNNLNVLVAEDNMVNQKVVAGILKKVGVKVTLVDNGRQAIEQLTNKSNFDVVLMDIEMPEMGGYEASQYIRQQLNVNVPIIALTAHAMSSSKAHAIDAGMNDHVDKPIQPHSLYHALVRALDSTASRRIDA